MQMIMTEMALTFIQETNVGGIYVENKDYNDEDEDYDESDRDSVYLLQRKRMWVIMVHPRP